MNQKSIITDQLKELVGWEVGPIEYEVEGGILKRFAKAMEDENPLWQDEEYAKGTRYGDIVAPPGFIVSLCRDELIFPVMEKIVSLTGHLKRMVNGGDDYQYFQPVKPGDVISVSLKLFDLREREGKNGKVLLCFFEQLYINQKNEIIAKAVHTVVVF